MQARKNKKKSAEVNQPFYMVWLFYILNLFRIQAMIARVPPQLPAAPKSKDKRSKSDESLSSTHKRMSSSKPVKNQTSVSKTKSASDSEISPPLLKFSVIPNQSILNAVSEVDSPVSTRQSPKRPSKITQKSDPAIVSVAQHSLVKSKATTKRQWEEIRDVVYKTVDQVNDPLPISMLEDSPVNQLVDKLAFLYRYQLLLISMRTLIKKEYGHDLEKARITLVHNADAHLFELDEFEETRKGLAAMDLSELSALSPGHYRITEFGIFDAMLDLPLCKFMAGIKEKGKPSAEEAKHWITKGAIPLLNLLFHIHEHTKSSQHQLACNHAIKMLVTIIGEYCPEVGNMDYFNEKFTVSEAGTYEAFIRDCRLLRNFYAHKSPISGSEWVEKELFNLGMAARKLNDQLASNKPEIITRLSPHTVKKHYQQEVKKLKDSPKMGR